MMSISKADAENPRTSILALYNQSIQPTAQIGKLQDAHTTASLRVLSFALSSSVRFRIVLTFLSSSPATQPQKQIKTKKKRNENLQLFFSSNQQR